MTQKFHIHLISDSTGDTIYSLTRACLVQFDHLDIHEHFWNLVRTERQMDFVIENIRENPGFVIYTLVDEKMQKSLHDLCRELHLPCYAVMEPLMQEFSRFFETGSQAQPGKQHALTDTYFSRISAIEYSLTHDDGQYGENLYQADIIIVGVSRTSKTPTCMYLANRGFKAANFPFVHNIPLPKELFEVKKPLIVGLTKSPQNLVEIRLNRLKLLNQNEKSDYVNPERVQEEVRAAKKFYTQHKWPVIDVTRRSIEETAAEIIRLLRARNQTQGPEA